MIIVDKNQEFKEIYEQFTKRQKNNLIGKQAIVVLSVRLIKVMYDLCNNKVRYSHDKVHGLNSYQQVA